MKRNFLLLFIFLQIAVNAQLIKKVFKQNLEFKDDESGTTMTYWATDEPFPFLVETKSSNHRGYELKYNYNKKIMAYQGKIQDEIYFDITAYGEDDLPFATGGKYYRLDEQLWEIGEYKNCKMLKTNEDDDTEIRAYFYDLKDGVDYFTATNSILLYYLLPEISNFEKLLGKGWIPVFLEKQSPQFYINYNGILTKVNNDTQKELLISERMLAESVQKNRNENDLETPYPVYCDVMMYNGDTDEKTSEMLNRFFMGMCQYYDYFGRYDLERFQKFFDSEILREAKQYVDDKTLTKKQAEKFIFEAREYSNLNQKDKLMTD